MPPCLCRHTPEWGQREGTDLAARMDGVVEKYSQLTCSRTGLPLMSEALQKVHNQQVQLARAGLLNGEHGEACRKRLLICRHLLL